jgi:hypothetical protein
VVIERTLQCGITREGEDEHEAEQRSTREMLKLAYDKFGLTPDDILSEADTIEIAAKMNCVEFRRVRFNSKNPQLRSLISATLDHLYACRSCKKWLREAVLQRRKNRPQPEPE